MDHETHTGSRGHDDGYRHDGWILHRPGTIADGVSHGAADVGVVKARARFGGVDLPATLAGMLTALGTAVILGGLLAGAARSATSSVSKSRPPSARADLVVPRTRSGVVAQSRRVARAR